jgi:deoxyadenosine/deoxycytidine kinase
MIIEFIGSTGAGKTTLIAEVQRRLSQFANVTTPFELLAAPLGLAGVTHPTTRNLIQELVGFPYLIRSLPQHKSSIAFSLRMLARKADSAVLTINNIRSLVRKIGAYEMMRRDKKDHVILVDEGTVLLAHVLFVYNKAYYTSEEITEFAGLVPLPDVIVYVKAPVDSLIKRSLQRSDPPREMKSKNPDEVEKYVNDAVAMFDELVNTEEIRSRLLVVDNPECADKVVNNAADTVTEFVLNHQTAPPYTRSTKFRAI